MQRNPLQPSATTMGPPQGFAEWGLDQVAYIKHEQMDGKAIYVVHAANGESLAAADTQALAAAMVVQNDMVPLYAH